MGRLRRGNAVMALRTNTFAASTAIAAAFSLLATPAAAIDLPKPLAVEVFNDDGWNAERDRRRRWDRGRYRHRNSIDAGDVVAGVLVIGAIAAIAGATKDRRERYEERYPDDDGYRSRTSGVYDRSDGRGIDSAVDSAVDSCVSEAERGAERVGSVDSAVRTPDGWRVSGELDNGAAWSCAIDNDGRISDMNLGTYGYGTAPAARAEDAQWSDEAYRRARENQRAGASAIDGDLAG